MLLNDTSQCPHCQHVLNEEANRRWMEDASGNRLADTKEEPCANCGEMVRIGLVRCWNCSAFMQSEIEEAYRRMQASPQPVIYSQLPESELEAPGSPDDYVSDVPSAADQDDEFQLGQGYELQSPSAKESQDAAAKDASAAAHPSGAAEKDSAANEAKVDLPDSESRAADDDDDEDVPHSVATGGDALLEVALKEQREEKHRKRKRKKSRLAGPRSETGMFIFCPNGHRIEVDKRHAGKTGRCPKCRVPFFVPLPEKKDDESAEGAADEADANTAGKFEHWQNDVHVHSIMPDKLKLKPGSLKPDFQLFDIAFAADEVLIASYSGKKGAAVAKTKKQQADREKLREYLRSGGPLSDVPAAEKYVLTAEQAKSISVAQPPLYPHESLFADVPVFGEGWIAVRLPIDDDPKIRRFASFTLTGFREFAQILNTVYGVEGLGEDVEIPLKDEFKEAKCHYSEATIEYLDPVDYYEADPSLELKLVGRKCAACGLVISEDSRKKEKIGGANGKAIAKAKCPKCQQKFGTNSLFALESPPPAEEKPEEEQSAKEEAPAAAG